MMGLLLGNPLGSAIAAIVIVGAIAGAGFWFYHQGTIAEDEQVERAAIAQEKHESEVREKVDAETLDANRGKPADAGLQPYYRD